SIYILDTLTLSDIFAIFISKDITVAYNVTKEYKITISENFLDGINFEQAIFLLKPLFEGNSKKIIYDSKLLRHTLDEYNIAINNICDDVCLMQYLVEYSAYKDFQSLKTHYDLLGEAVALFNLRDILYKQLVDTNTQKLYTDIEMPLANVLYHMEKDGVKVDCDYLNKLSIQFTAQIKDIESEIFALAGVTFNISSPKQLSEVLFVNLGLTPTKKTKSGYSTDNDVLMSLRGQHDIIDKIVTYRQVTKLNGTYIEGQKPLIKDGFVHTTYNQALNSTGRLSSSDPNLQNIPVRNEMGKEIRKLFIPQFDILVGADYSQIELRLLASFSGDENMLSAFNSGKDIHALVASELLNVPLSMVTSAMRRMAKAV
ncbi:MAG: DNA polymerase, partial [Clostridia bacterium]